MVALLSMVGSRKGLLHYLYLDNDFRFSPLLAPYLNYTLTGTLHHPPEMLGQVFTRLDDLKKLDGIFCVGENQVAFVKNIVRHERVWFVPHGVNVDFFSPADLPQPDQPSCLFVGSMLRDFDLLRKVILELHKKFTDLVVTVVVAREKQSLFLDLPGIRILSGITDIQLRDEYRKASLLLLPLTNCTANNSVLEAISCGLPVVTNDVGGIRGYLDQDCSILCRKSDVEDMVGATIELLSNEDLLSGMRLAARKRALLFSWEEVRTQALDIFKTFFSLDFEVPSGEK
jgi:glycosyltransferase involved in cell wall biosynthesis